MKPILFLALLVPVSALAQSSADIPAAITQLEHRWAEAQAAGKPDNVAPLLADDFISIGTDGKLTTKSELLAGLKPGHWDRNEISDVKVIVHDNVAVATGLWAGKGQMGDRHIDLTERWTDTWIRTTSGQWQCLASQQTEIKP
jgi:ketosteroid isomerase-like protein